MLRMLAATSPDTQTLIAPGRLGKIHQMIQFRNDEISEMMIFWSKNNPVIPRM